MHVLGDVIIEQRLETNAKRFEAFINEDFVSWLHFPRTFLLLGRFGLHWDWWLNVIEQLVQLLCLISSDVIHDARLLSVLAFSSYQSLLGENTMDQKLFKNDGS
jgi:hypothetical protein